MTTNHRKPFRTEITLDGGYVTGADYATEQEALDARDRAFQMGFSRVRVLGLPLVAYAAGFGTEDEEDIVLLDS